MLSKEKQIVMLRELIEIILRAHGYGWWIGALNETPLNKLIKEVLEATDPDKQRKGKNMGINDIAISIYSSMSSAPNFNAPKFRNARLDSIHVIENKTAKNLGTVDFIFTDDKGQQHIAMASVHQLLMLCKQLEEK